MVFLASIGAVVCAIIAAIMAWVLFVIAGNIYGGVKGAYRLREIACRSGHKRSGHWSTIKYGLGGWYGRRYNGDVGTYILIGRMEVSQDGRDPIYRSRFYGAGTDSNHKDTPHG